MLDVNCKVLSTPLVCPLEGVKEFAGQRGRSSILDRPPFSKGGLEGGKHR